ncbi:MAG TPA: Ig-like domain-containing protein, partial [Anaerolineae bacterium]
MRNTSNTGVKVIGLVAVLSMVLSACNQLQTKPGGTLSTPSTVASGTAVADGTAGTSTTAVPTAGPTSTPRPPSDPILVDRQPVRGEELQLDNPIVLTFDQPMDHSSVEQALQVSPRLDGKFTWTSDNVVSFKPSKGWDRARSYTVILTDTAKSARGLILARPESFNVSTIGYLEVAQTIPAADAQDVSADSKITLLFNRPVVSLTLIGQQSGLPSPVVFDPPIAGQGEWLNTSIYLYRPSKPLAAGTTYTGTIAAGLADTTGALLQKNVTWSFKVAPPTVKALSPEDTTIDVDLRRPISITFNQKMDHASAEATFKITPAVKGAFQWADEQVDTTQAQQNGKQPGPLVGTQPQPVVANGEVMAFIPAEDYQRGTLYKVEIASGARAVGGVSAMPQGRSFSFRTIETPGVASTVPANGDTKADATSGFAIRFSAPVLPETIAPNLKFEPALTLTRVYSYYDPSEKRFFLNVDLLPSTRYKVTIGGDIADKYGVKIGKDSLVQFTTAPYMPYAVLNTSGQMGTYDASKPSRLFATYRNVSRLDFELSSLTMDQFFQFTGADNAADNLRQFTPTDQQRIRKWSVQASSALNEMAFASVDLSPDKGSLQPGIYLLKLSAPEAAATVKYYEPARHILIVSNLHVSLKQGEREALAWVTNLGDGQPTAGLPVSFRDRTFSEAGKGSTGADGQLLMKFAGSFEEYAPFYAVVGQPGDANFGVAYNRWDSGISPYDFNLQAQFGSTHYTAYLYTERPIYRPGQMVYFKGIVRSEDDARYSLPQALTSADVTINNDQGQQVFSSTQPINANGAFSGSFALDNSAPTGFYFIQTCLPALAPVG